MNEYVAMAIEYYTSVNKGNEEGTLKNCRHLYIILNIVIHAQVNYIHSEFHIL